MGYKLFIYFTIATFCMSHHVYSQLDVNFYDETCPPLPFIVRFNLMSAFRNDIRIAASLLRLHFHDCFVNGCDASVLLDETKDFKGEKNALPNRNSIRGFEVIENMKADVERACPSIVSCVDLLTLAAREAVFMSGGPFWPVPLGRRDGTTASEKGASEQLPSPFEPLNDITKKFTSKGFNIKDVVALSGAHTIGYVQCFLIKNRLFNFKGTTHPDPTLHSSLLAILQTTCPDTNLSDTRLAPLDTATTYTFDNSYYTNLVNNMGVLDSDIALMRNAETSAMVGSYSKYPMMFLNDFAESMVKLGNIGILTGQNGQIRKKCGLVN